MHKVSWQLKDIKLVSGQFIWTMEGRKEREKEII